MPSQLTHHLQVAALILALFSASLIPFTQPTTAAATKDMTVSAQDALVVVNAKLVQSNKTGYTVDSLTPISVNGDLLFYIIGLQPTGYMVVPAYRYLPVVMAYSWTSPFGVYSTVNPLFNMLITDLSQRVTAAAALQSSLLTAQSEKWDEYLNHPSMTLFQQWPPEGSSPTDGWVQTLWTQDPPYNNMCPVINGQRSVVGCPATAMAQILNYFKTTNNIQFTDADDYHHNYSGADFWIDNDFIQYQFPSWPQLNSYLQTVESHWASNTSLTDQDKAALSVAAGFSMEQVYNPGGSGTFNVGQAYQGYQRFGFNNSVLFNGESQEMFDHLSRNMRTAIPAHIAVVNEQWTVGHNMVVDGYNTDNYYHINFGWGGSANGWYHIPDDLPYQLTVIEGVIVDIMPTGPNQPPTIPGGIHGPSETQVNLMTPYRVDQAVDPEGDPVTYTWDWGDGTTNVTAGNSSVHAWTAQGQYVIKVKATDSLGAESDWSTPFPVTVTAPKPVLVIVPSSHGIGVSAAIENHGGLNATSVVWTLKVFGGFFDRVAVNKSGTITSIPAGQSQTIATGSFLGIGRITVEITAACSEGNTTSLTNKGWMFLVWARLS